MAVGVRLPRTQTDHGQTTDPNLGEKQMKWEVERVGTVERKIRVEVDPSCQR